jgi:hypothetical protein
MSDRRLGTVPGCCCKRASSARGYGGFRIACNRVSVTVRPPVGPRLLRVKSARSATRWPATGPCPSQVGAVIGLDARVVARAPDLVRRTFPIRGNSAANSALDTRAAVDQDQDQGRCCPSSACETAHYFTACSLWCTQCGLDARKIKFWLPAPGVRHEPGLMSAGKTGLTRRRGVGSGGGCLGSSG